MKIDFTQPILDLSGEPIVEKDKPVTLGTVAVNALLATLLDNGQPEQLTGEAKVRHAKTAQAIFTTPKLVELTAEDIADIKSRIARSYPSLVVMRAWALLDA